MFRKLPCLPPQQQATLIGLDVREYHPLLSLSHSFTPAHPLCFSCAAELDEGKAHGTIGVPTDAAVHHSATLTKAGGQHLLCNLCTHMCAHACVCVCMCVCVCAHVCACVCMCVCVCVHMYVYSQVHVCGGR